ncbi:MAG: ElyC/SanA/YdcF family protein [Patescibacteria group bacterium]
MKKRYIFLGLVLIGMAVVFSPGLIQTFERSKMYSPNESIPPAEVALVFGAGLNENGRPSDALADRLITAAGLYNNGTVEKILVSGDSVTDEYYDEPGAMTTFLITWGIPTDVIEQDPAGLSTYDSCLRAKEIWGLESAILVTQEFHLPRALFTCNALGIESVGVVADQQPYVFGEYYQKREWLATYKALLDLYLPKADPQGLLDNKVAQPQPTQL